MLLDIYQHAIARRLVVYNAFVHLLARAMDGRFSFGPSSVDPRRYPRTHGIFLIFFFFAMNTI